MSAAHAAARMCSSMAGRCGTRRVSNGSYLELSMPPAATHAENGASLMQNPFTESLTGPNLLERWSRGAKPIACFAQNRARMETGLERLGKAMAEI
jgi:hypothetical protein